MKNIKVMFLCAVLGACTNAGPFVSNISSDNDGGIEIEKCMVHMNAFMGTISNGNCSSYHIKLK